jgi:hypothetical protein
VYDTQRVLCVALIDAGLRVSLDVLVASHHTSAPFKVLRCKRCQVAFGNVQ